MVKQKKDSLVVKRLSKNSNIYTSILRSIQDKKVEKISVIDLRKLNESVADFFFICEISNSKQMLAVVNEMEDGVYQKIGERPYAINGLKAKEWIIVDYVNIVVHLMSPEAKEYYQLEDLWSDGQTILY